MFLTSLSSPVTFHIILSNSMIYRLMGFSRQLLCVVESGRWPEVGGVCGVQQRPVGSSLESLWDSMRETCSAREAGAAGGISGLLRDLSLSEAPSPGSAAPPSKRQCRSLSCSDELGCRSSWRPQGSRVWTSVEKRRCHSGGSVQRGAFAPSGFPAMQRSSSFSLPTRINPPETFSHGFPFAAFSASPQTPQALYLSHEQICPTEFSSPDSTPELERRHSQGLARSRSQPCVHNDKKTGVKRRRPADSHKHRPSLDLLKMTQVSRVCVCRSSVNALGIRTEPLHQHNLLCVCLLFAKATHTHTHTHNVDDCVSGKTAPFTNQIFCFYGNEA
uniref:Family with sequence similarity 53 member B n=1 Tax=Cyprinus carpio TaxID=7962 RepID=A0A8C2DLJ0_CYPCA